MDLGLRGKVALVTGASRGIGRGIALGLAREGCRLVICARGEEDLESAAAQIRDAGAEVLALPLDVTAAAADRRLVDAAGERFGAVDILVSNVGGNRRGDFEELDDEDWAAVLDLNFTSHVRLARRLVPAMRERRAGVLLFIASIYGREAGGPGLALYNSTKSALISMAKILALELAPHGVRVLSVAPGSVRFPDGSWDRRVRADPEGMARWVERNLPRGRFGTVEEVADAVTFLVSDRASLLTGVCLNIDGGQSHSLI